MRIFITGGTGFIGKHIVRKLKENEDNNLLLLSQASKKELSWLDISENTKVIEGDLSALESLRMGLEDFKPEVTIHLAWEGLPNYDPKISIRNLNYGLNLINLLAEIGCKSVLAAGSCWEYGQQSGKIPENTPPKPLNAFTAAKHSLHLLGKEIAKENNAQFIWTRFFYVYGPGQREASLIPYLIHCAKTGEIPEIKNPSARNDFIYVEDIAEAITLILKKCKESTVYNIGSGHLISTQEVLKIIFDNYGLQEQYKNVKPEPTDVFSGFYADISKIKTEIGWKPKTGIEEGIKKTIDYYRN